MCSMSLTVVVSDRSNGVVIRPDIWSGGKPVYCQTTPITGIRISGKMSVGVRSVASGPIINSSSASTTKVYGRLSAIRTNAIIKRAFPKKTRIGQPGGQFVALIYPNCEKKPTPATLSADIRFRRPNRRLRAAGLAALTEFRKRSYPALALNLVSARLRQIRHERSRDP
jgi:hypothetical protein